MATKKKIFKLFAVLSLLFGQQALATSTGYEPLVNIPGLETGGVIDISAYLVGIYNFLLSIVGIVAVAMLIIGGMKYITAAGNSGAVSSARESIKDALLGLLIAILSWVIVGTINPDVLYLRQPGLAIEESSGSCATFNLTNKTCTCRNGTSLGTAYANLENCNDACLDQDLCAFDTTPTYCIAPGSLNSANEVGFSGETDQCTCGDRSTATLPEGSTCEERCKSLGKCGHKFLVIKLHTGHDGDQDGGTYTVRAESGDELWDFALTNNGSFGDFNVKTESKTGDNDGDGDIDKSDQKFNCAVFVTREINLGEDYHWIYWVRSGTKIHTIGTLRDSLLENAIGCCGTGDDCSMDLVLGGVCSEEEVAPVINAKFGGDAIWRCNDCSFAQYEGEIVHYGPKAELTCNNGYWQY